MSMAMETTSGYAKSATIVEMIPQQPQRQDSLVEQLRTLHIVANRIGCYDAADFLKHLCEGRRPII